MLLLVDEIVKSEQVADQAEWPLKILSSIGELLDTFAYFNAMASPLKLSPII